MAIRKLAARSIVGLVSVVTAVGTLQADFLSPTPASQHIRNPRWPGHAKFHNAQYVVMNALLGSLGLVLLTSRKGDPDRNLLTAAAIVATPWLGMFGATRFPGTALSDEEFADVNRPILGMNANVFIGTCCLSALAIAVGLDRRPA
jgi:hypothetical protein